MTTPTLSRPKLPIGFRRMIRLDDEWPLFSLTVVPSADRRQAWAYLSNLPDLSKKPDAWTHLFHEWKRLERWCYHDGIHGWYCICDGNNVRFTRWLLAIGAEVMGTIPGRGIQFQKAITGDPSAFWSIQNMKDLAAFIRQGRTGHA